MARAGLGSPYATFVQAAAEASTMAEASANPTTAAAEAAANQETAEATAVPTSDPGTPNPTTPQHFRLHTPLDSGATTIQEMQDCMKTMMQTIENLQQKLKALERAPSAVGPPDPFQASGSDPWRAARPTVAPPGVPFQPGTVEPLRPPDKKDVQRPSAYSGKIDDWLSWSKNFKKFLRRADPRWHVLLEQVEAQRGKPVTAEMEAKWSAELALGPISIWKDYLNLYLENYTTGAARVTVDACGDAKALDAWRILADKGCSLRPAHANTLRRKAFWPRQNVPAKELDVAIASWEADVELFEKATGEMFPTANRRMHLEDMCPEKLRSHLRAQGAERFPTCDLLKIEISDWLADELNKSGHIKVEKSLGAVENPEAEEGCMDEWEEQQFYSAEMDCWLCGLVPKRPRTSDGDEDVEMKVADSSLGKAQVAKG